ncbi:MAG: hypothetical protein V4667_04835 [Bacteroidota bacterium]
MKFKIFNTKSLLTTLIASFLFVTACTEGYFDFDKVGKGSNWNPNFAIPLAKATLTVKDILFNADKDGNILTDGNGFLTLVYKSNLFSKSAEEVINIPNQNLTQFNFSMNATDVAAFNLIPTGSQFTVPLTQDVPVVITSGSSSKIDSILFKNLEWIINMRNNFPHNCSVKLTLPNAKKNGVAYQRTFAVPANGVYNSNPFEDLAGYSFNMTYNGGQNTYQMQLEFTFTKSASAATTSDLFIMDQSLANTKFAKFFGYIDEKLLTPTPDTTAISFFNNAAGTPEFLLVDPKIKLSFANSFGVALQSKFVQFDGVNTYQGVTQTTNLGLTNTINIAAPTFSQLGSVIMSSFLVDKTNSSIVDFINRQPKQIILQFETNTVPNGNTNFVLDTSRLKVDVEVELPFHGIAKNIVFIDTVEIENFENIEESVESATIRLYTSNGFPVELFLELAYADEYGNKLGYFIPASNSHIIQSGAIDSDGRVVSKTEKLTDIIITKNELTKAKFAKKLIVFAKASSTDNGDKYVKFYSDYTLDVRLGVQTKINVKF